MHNEPVRWAKSPPRHRKWWDYVTPSSLAVGLLFGTPAIAGTVELTSGGLLAGSVRNVNDAKSPYAVVALDDDLSIAIAGVHVRRAIADDQLADYREQVRAAGNDDAEKQFQLSRWCKQQNLLPQSQYHLTRTIQIDPDHKLARAALGYVSQGRTWVSYAELKRSQGLILDRSGRWVLPEVIAGRALDAEADKSIKQWKQTVSRLQSRAIKGDTKAVAELAAITDSLAAEAFADELKASRGNQSKLPRAQRMLYLKKLGEFRTTPALATIVETGLVEADATIREEALRLLQESGASSAVASYLPLLGSGDPNAVKLAARALAYFPDSELAFSYIAALTTTQKVKIQQGSGETQAGFSNTGGIGFSSGTKTIEQTRVIQQPDVLQLLRAIAPGVDLGYDQTAWRNYFANLRSPAISDLRRDE